MTNTAELIDHSEQLEQCVKGLQKSEQIAIDLEFDKNFHRYGFNLCLVQIFDGNSCYLIDPLSTNLNIELLFPLLEDNSVQKVCFSFDEDLRLLHSIGCFPKNLYDLDIASRMLNYPAMSLTNLVEEVLDVELVSSSQKSNWYKRPLTEKQLAYAADDVLHLLKLKELFDGKISSEKVSDWINEENESLNKLNYSNINHNEIVKEKDKNHFSEFEWHIYKKLLYWRDELAEKYNKPPFQIVDNNLIKTLAKNPSDRIHWLNRRGVYKRLKTKEVSDEIIQLLSDAQAEADEMGLSREKPAKKQLNSEEYKEMMTEKRRVNLLKSTFFKPVKERVEEVYGSEFANYILSNRIISDIITGSNGQIKSYKLELIEQVADDLNLDTQPLKECIRLNGNGTSK
ncbi:MAG: HRDC domain-containing protein [Balneolaceae bacterium]|nr:HRDC domain-containing protein [Balneolaceae bacterium]